MRTAPWRACRSSKNSARGTTSKMLSVAELIRYRLKHERFISRLAEGCVQTEFGDFRTIAYTSDLNPETHVALVRGDVAGKERVLVRMHSRCMFGDVFASTTCDCARLVRRSMQAIAEAGEGVLVYLHGTGIGFRIGREGYEAPRLMSHQRGEAPPRQLQHE